MKAKLFLLSLAMLVISAPLFANSRVVDNAGLLSATEAASLRQLADNVSLTYNFDIVIVTESDIGNANTRDYADDYFDNNGYGLGQSRDGCLFLLVMGTREYWFSTSGRGIRIFSGTAADKLENNMLNYLGNGNYYNAFSAFAKGWEELLFLDAEGSHSNFFEEYNLILVAIAWLLSLGIGFIIVGIWKKGMNTALPQTQAAAFIVSGSLSFTVQQDQFLYSSVSRTPMASNSGSPAGRGSIHTGSSGMSHGGRGGKF
jgi:uncharacterized protein